MSPQHSPATLSAETPGAGRAPLRTAVLPAGREGSAVSQPEYRAGAAAERPVLGSGRGARLGTRESGGSPDLQPV